MSGAGKSLVIGYPGAVAVKSAEAMAAAGRSVAVMVTPGREREARVWASEVGGVEVVTGDPEKIDLGLSGERYLELAGEVSCIHYLPGPSIESVPEEVDRLRWIARELVELARAAGDGLDKVVILSHMDVAGQHEGPFAEDDLDRGQRFQFEDQRARFVLERILRRFVDEIRLVLLRPGWVVGQSRGTCPIVRIALAGEEPNPRQADDPMLLTDLDRLSQIVAVLDRDDAVPSGTTLHLAGEPALTVEEMFRVVTEIAEGLVPSGYDLAAGARRVIKQAEGEPRWSPKDMYKRQAPGARFASRQTDDFLEGRGLEFPRVDRERLEPLVVRAVEEIVGFR